MFFSCAMWALVATSAWSEERSNPLTESESWDAIRYDVVGEAEIADGGALFEVGAPYRANDAATVPITISQTNAETQITGATTDGERAYVDVEDQGPGVAEEHRNSVFEPFFTTKDVGKGTGLGLDIVRRIVSEKHKGSIRFDTGPEGTTFQVRLPLNPKKEDGN